MTTTRDARLVKVAQATGQSVEAVAIIERTTGARLRVRPRQKPTPAARPSGRRTLPATMTVDEVRALLCLHGKNAVSQLLWKGRIPRPVSARGQSALFPRREMLQIALWRMDGRPWVGIKPEIKKMEKNR